MVIKLNTGRPRLDILDEGGETDIGGHLLMLYALTRGIKAKRVIEIGVREGYSTLAFLEALADTGGALWSIDLNDCPRPKDFYKKYFLENTPKWKFIRGDSTDEKTIQSVPKEVDLLFIDGNHSYESVRDDYVNYYSLVKKGGYLVMHDSQLPGPKKFLESINPLVWDGSIEFPYCNGLTILRKAL